MRKFVYLREQRYRKRAFHQRNRPKNDLVLLKISASTPYFEENAYLCNMNWTLFLLYYLAGINLVTFLTYGIDKWKARKSRWRIKERTLILLAAVGGSIGAWIAMTMFHHKTLHKKFYLGIPAIFLGQLALVLWLLLR